MESLLNKNPLTDPVRLETIDKLFEFNIGEYVSLPQILVVGDQSSGKSSVLEGLTKLPFPRDSGLCTRFATKITFRRAHEQKIAVSIIPPGNATAKHAEKLRRWKKDELGSLDTQTFSKILREVYPLMGLDSSGEDVKTFSDGVLQIDIQGPEQQHLSVIDVPGIFKNTTPGLTTKSDMIMVKNMVSRYMKNPRAAILAIIPANVDIATQEILEIAKEHDPRGERTLGVLTKPDLVDKGAEHHVMDLVEGKSHQLGLGWCIVRNLGQKESLNSESNRHELEEGFFASHEPWARLHKNNVGIKALQTRLRGILAEIVRREFPSVKSDIQIRLSSCRQQLDALGSCRETTEQQRKYLITCAGDFQKLITLAFETRSRINPPLNDMILEIVATMVLRNECFSSDVSLAGHAVGLDPEQENPGSVDVKENVEDNETNKVELQSQKVQKLPVELNNLLGTENLSSKKYEIKKEKEKEILPWLKTIYESSRGFELGTFDTALIPLIWRKYSVNWDPLALGYISDMIYLVHATMICSLRQACPDENAFYELKSALLEEMLTRYRKAIDQVKFILQVEREGTPLTLNHYFNDNLQKCREARINPGFENEVVAFRGRQMVPVDAVCRHRQMSNLDHAVQDLHDILKSYYKVARKRFVDVVCMQAVDFHLIAGPDTPFKVFSPTYVMDLSSEQLQEIAGETSIKQQKRANLKREIKNLEEGQKILI